MSNAILVTGGAGYVGSHACKALAAAGYRPIVYDNLSRGHREAVRWGPLIEGEIGEDHDPETHLIPRVLRAALGAGEPVEVYGSDYPTADGTAIRDYIHVADLGDAHVRALGYLGAGGENGAMNLGTGEGCSVRQVIAAVERIAGRA